MTIGKRDAVMFGWGIDVTCFVTKTDWITGLLLFLGILFGSWVIRHESPV